jgi:hypothetical protein
VVAVAVPAYVVCNLFAYLGLYHSHQNQFAYQPGKSTEVALHHVVPHIRMYWNTGKLHLELL